MDARTNLKLSEEEVRQIFDKEFDEEYSAFENNIRAVARGNTGLANSWTDYLGLGGISAGTVLTNSTFGLLVGLKVISAFVSVGAGAAVSAVGITAGVVFRKYRLKKKRQEYQDAEQFIESELYDENLNKFREGLFNNLYPVLKKSSAGEINYIVKTVISAIANLILDGKVKKIEDLNKGDFLDLLQSSTKVDNTFALNTKFILEVIRDLDAAKNPEEKFDIEAIAKVIEGESKIDIEIRKPTSGSLFSLSNLFASNVEVSDGSGVSNTRGVVEEKSGMVHR